MAYTSDEQNTAMSSALTEDQAEAPHQYLTEALMEELGMSEKEFLKANRLVNTMLTAVQRHVPFNEFSELVTHMPEEWEALGKDYWQQIPYQERMKTIFPLVQEVIQQDQMDRNFDILYTEDAFDLLQGIFRVIRKL